ncbi:BQ5605_C009g05573 [Microbotryum silenes-dioicae]|uniref:BQ5605_C009g05573 protein n=1 Tax=Microbotryum silenes-dioicae TaxID=796604 RepID=A0A2X0MGT8_9BASI|nr:BQ5605_C009g05573 [Microbotryum silenes-dioicae]
MVHSSGLVYLAFVGLVGQAMATRAPRDLHSRAGKISTSLPLHKRVSRRSNGLSDLDTRIAQLLTTKSKYGLSLDEEDFKATSRLSKRASGSQVALAGNDESYYASISLGTPSYTYEVALDTGSADLVMITSDANMQACGSECTITSQLYPATNGSSSAKSLGQSVDIVYGTGSANGVLVADTMTMGGFTAQQNIAACDNVTGLTTSPDQSGLMGLAFQALSASGSMPFLQGLYTAGSLSQPLFALAGASIGPQDVPSFDAVVPGGFMDIGTTNSSLYTGTINYVGLTAGKGLYWQIPLDAMTVQGTNLGISASAVVIDSGTNSIAVPQSVASAIYAGISGSQAIPNSGGLYAYPCATSVTLTMTFGGVVYSMLPKNFNTGTATKSGTYCVGAVSSLGTSQSAKDTFIVGTPFLMSLYQVYRFEPPAVGFATITTASVLTSGGIPESNGTSASGGPSSGSKTPVRITATGTAAASATGSASGSSGSSSTTRGSALGAILGLAMTAGAFAALA